MLRSLEVYLPNRGSTVSAGWAAGDAAGDELDPARRSPRPAGAAQLDHPVSDLDFIPAQPPRNLVHRDATNEHLTQRVHLRIRPLSAGIHGQRFVICLGPPRIED